MDVKEDAEAKVPKVDKTGTCFGVDRGLVYLSQINNSYYCCSKFESVKDIVKSPYNGITPTLRVFVNQDKWCALEEPATFLTADYVTNL
jgi:hypothetical protein